MRSPSSMPATGAARGLIFRETMSGPFALGESEPALGSRAGRAARTALTIRVAVTIDDIDAFVRDPTHAAQLGGEISFGPFGDRISAADGMVRLFAPANASEGRGQAKVMQYGLRFQHGGREHYLVGVKRVDGRSPFAMWTETTTLYTRLHDGLDELAPILGSGILRLGPMDLLRMLPTMHPTPTTGVVTGARTVLNYGLFFAGELWDSYVARRPPAGSRGADARGV